MSNKIILIINEWKIIFPSFFTKIEKAAGVNHRTTRCTGMFRSISIVSAAPG